MCNIWLTVQLQKAVNVLRKNLYFFLSACVKKILSACVKKILSACVKKILSACVTSGSSDLARLFLIPSPHWFMSEDDLVYVRG